MPAEFEDFFRTVRADLAAQPMAPPAELRRAGSRRIRNRRAGGVAALAAAAVVVAVGFTQLRGGPSSAPLPPVGPTTNVNVTDPPSSSSATPAATSATTSAPASASVPSTTPGSSQSSAAHPTSSPPCPMAQLSVTEGHFGAASGLQTATFVFRNTGTTACRLQGYPVVAAVDTSGKQIFAARPTPRGGLGGLPPFDVTPPVVDLKPGQAASAVEEYEAPAVSQTIPCATISTVRSFQITIPGSSGRATMPRDLTGSCSDDLEVHPFVPGDQSFD